MTTAKGISNAPWTPEEVQSLNEYQECGRFHPYMCKCEPSKPMVATANGWECRNHPQAGEDQSWELPFCHPNQTSAHDCLQQFQRWGPDSASELEPLQLRVHNKYIELGRSGEAFDPTNERHIELACSYANLGLPFSSLEVAIAYVVDRFGVSPEAAARYVVEPETGWRTMI